MADKDPKDALNSYVSDMLSLEHHIKKAIDGQISDLNDYPTVRTELERIQSTIEFHISALEGVLNARGGQASSPLKKAGSALLGLGAAAIDLVRNEGLPKNLRDTYTAFSLANIGYVMLQTTALSLNDREVASLAQRHLGDYAREIVALQNIIPAAVVRFLQEEGLPASQAAAAEVVRNVEQVWRVQSGASTGASAGVGGTGGVSGGSAGGVVQPS